MQLFEWHLLVNQNAGAGKARKIMPEIIKKLKEYKIKYKCYYTEHAGHEKRIVTQLLNQTLVPYDKELPVFPLLVVVGGDGTLHGVVNMLKKFPEIPIGYIPGGSGNDFARGVGIPNNPIEAMDKIVQAKKPRSLYLINSFLNRSKKEVIGLNNLGVGLDAAVVRVTNASKMKSSFNSVNMGAFSYLSNAFGILRKQKGFPIDITVNGRTHHFNNAYLCTVTNHPYFGGGLAIDPTATAENEELNLIVIEKIALYKIMALIPKLLKKTHLASPHVRQFKGQEIKLRSTSHEFGQIDGEELRKDPIDIDFYLTSHLFWF